MVKTLLFFVLVVCGQFMSAKESIDVIKIAENDSIVSECRKKALPILSEFFEQDSSIAIVGINDTCYFVIVGKYNNFKYFYAVVDEELNHVSKREALQTYLWNTKEFKKHKKKSLSQIRKAGDIYKYPYESGFIKGVRNCKKQFGDNVYFTIFENGVRLTECLLPIVYHPKPIDSNLWGFMVNNLIYEIDIDIYNRLGIRQK